MKRESNEIVLRIEDLKYNVLSQEFTAEDIAKPGWELESSMGCVMTQERFYKDGFDEHCLFVLVTEQNKEYLDAKFKLLKKLAKEAVKEGKKAPKAKKTRKPVKKQGEEKSE